MNIWIVNQYAMPPKYEERIRTSKFAEILQKKGCSVKIISSSALHSRNLDLMDGTKNRIMEKTYDGLEFVHVKTNKYNGNGFLRIKNHLLFCIRLLLNSKRISTRPDVILCDTYVPFAVFVYFVAKTRKAKFILEVRDLWPESLVAYGSLKKNSIITKLLYQSEKWIYKKSDRIIFTMEGGKDYIIEKGWDKDNGGPVDITKVYHINNGVDLEVFNYNKENYKFEDNDLDNPTTFKVIYAGSIRLVNNVKSIVDTAFEIKKLGIENIKFIIYGEGSDRTTLEQYCYENGIDNIIFKGFIGKSYIPYVLSKSDLNILHFEQNKIKKYGASLNKLFEYFASGKPTISDCEFGYDLINKYKCGVVIDNADAKIMAEEIIRISRFDVEQYNVLCANASRAAENYNFINLSNNLVEILGECNNE